MTVGPQATQTSLFESGTPNRETRKTGSHRPRRTHETQDARTHRPRSVVRSLPMPARSSGDPRVDGYTLWAYADVFKGIVLDILL